MKIQNLENMNYFEKFTIFNEIDKFYYYIGVILLVILCIRINNNLDILFYTIIIVVISVYIISNIDFNNRNLEIENINNKYEKFRETYKYLWIDANFIYFIDSILYIRNYCSKNFDDLVLNINNLCYYQYIWEYKNKEKTIDDIQLYLYYYKNILNTFQTFYVSCPSSEKYNLTQKQNELYEILESNVILNIEKYSPGWFILNMPNYNDIQDKTHNELF